MGDSYGKIKATTFFMGRSFQEVIKFYDFKFKFLLLCKHHINFVTFTLLYNNITNKYTYGQNNDLGLYSLVWLLMSALFACLLPPSGKG